MLSRRYRSVLVGTTSAITLAAAMPAFAADAPQQAQAVVGIEEIIVTARRVEENIQRVPIAVTAFTADQLAQKDIADLWSVQRITPGLTIAGAPGNAPSIVTRI